MRGKRAKQGRWRSLSRLRGCLAKVPDWREAAGQRHPLDAILALVVVGTVCDCPNLEAIADWGRWLPRRLLGELGFTRKTSPCRSTVGRVLEGLDVAAFEAVLREWCEALDERERDELRAVAIDGKTSRGSSWCKKDLPGIHVLSAFDVGRGAVLASVPVDAKTNEAKAAVPLLASLELADTVVTGDAAFTQKEICEGIAERGGHYLLAVKDNQPSLREAIEVAFDRPDSPL